MSNTTTRISDIALTSFAPVVWGSTYLVTTLFLPPSRPLTAALIRSLPIGVVLLAAFWRQSLSGWLTPLWLARLFVLGILNIGAFQALLFVAAYRLPGGVAATLGAITPLFAVLFAWPILGLRPTWAGLFSGLAGLAGVAFLVLTPKAHLDMPGILAALGGALSMSTGTLLAKRWQPPVAAPVFAAWQLAMGGLFLLPLTLGFESSPDRVTSLNIGGYLYLSIIGGGLAYALWFRGIGRLYPSAVASLGLLSPLSATALGWIVLDQSLSPAQAIGAALILGAVWAGQSRTTK